MEKYNIGEVWWIHFPYDDEVNEKRRPAIVIDNETIAILATYVTSKNKDNPYSIEIEDWEKAGLPKPSWTRIDKIVRINEWYMDKKIGDLSQKDLTKIMQLVVEITSDITHEFSLIAVKNHAGKYLQKFDERWKCWLFPYIRSTDNNKLNVDKYVSELFSKEISSTYITCEKHCKYSVSDDAYKIYNHKLYMVLIDTVPYDIKEDEFCIAESHYRWMSIEEMEQDETIMEKNDDIVAFVKTKCSGKTERFW